jgi:hypothetical protein
VPVNKKAYFELIGHDPHPQQWLFHNSPARFRVPCCGRRFGKSTMAARDRAPELMIPRNRGWIVGPTYDLGEKEFRIMWNDLIIGQRMGRDRRVKKAYNVKQGNMYIEFPIGSRVEVRSADKPDTLVGEGLDWVIVAEAAKQREETWQKYLQPALADKRGGADFPTTPEGMNWLYRVWRYGQNPEFKDWESWTFPSWSNIRVFPDGERDPEILRMKAETSPEWFAQEIGASFTSVVGRIYPEWDEFTNVRSVPFRPDLPNYIAFDWGYSNPMAAIEFQVEKINGYEVIRVWREHYKAYTTLREHKYEMKQREQPPGYHLDMGFGDAEDPEAVVEMQDLVPTVALPEAKENWRDGVECVREFLKRVETGFELDEYGTPEIMPRFYVDHSCPNVIREFNGYRSAPPPKTGVDAQDKPHKADDHAMDAIRYGLVHLFRLGANRHLNELVLPPRQPVQVYDEADLAEIERLERSLLGVNSNNRGSTIFSFAEDADNARF